MLYLINDINFEPQILDIDYLETGHTHMPADSVHAHIATKIKKSHHIYDHNCYKKIIENCRDKEVLVKNILHEDLHKFPNECRKNTGLIFKTLKTVRFEKIIII